MLYFVVVRRSSCLWWRTFRPSLLRLWCALCSSTAAMLDLCSSAPLRLLVWVHDTSDVMHSGFLFNSKFPPYSLFALRNSCFLFVSLQKMLQSPYFFFDVIYLHNGLEEQGDETSWRVSREDFWLTDECERCKISCTSLHVLMTVWLFLCFNCGNSIHTTEIIFSSVRFFVKMFSSLMWGEAMTFAILDIYTFSAFSLF